MMLATLARTLARTSDRCQNVDADAVPFTILRDETSH